PGLAILPRKRLAGEPGGPVVAQVKHSDDTPALPRIGHAALDVKPGRAPRWPPSIADPHRREGVAHGVRIADRFTANAKGRQLERSQSLLNHLGLMNCLRTAREGGRGRQCPAAPLVSWLRRS